VKKFHGEGGGGGPRAGSWRRRKGRGGGRWGGPTKRGSKKGVCVAFF